MLCVNKRASRELAHQFTAEHDLGQLRLDPPLRVTSEHALYDFLAVEGYINDFLCMDFTNVYWTYGPSRRVEEYARTRAGRWPSRAMAEDILYNPRSELLESWAPIIGSTSELVSGASL